MERRDLLRRLRGHGLEIGALTYPLPLPPGASVRYVDLLTVEDARRHFPELQSQAIVEPDLLAPADRLAAVADASQDFVVAHHVLEHLEDPIAALHEWRRVLRPGGLLFLGLPDPRRTFDRNRPRTGLAHVTRDHDDGPSPARRERDLVAYREWVRNFREGRTDAQVDFWARLLQRAGYAIHFHVWLPEDARALIAHVGGFEEEAWTPLEDEREFVFLLRASG